MQDPPTKPGTANAAQKSSEAVTPSSGPTAVDGEPDLYLPWYISFGIPFVGVVGFFGILALAGITFLPPAPTCWPIKVTVLPDAAKGAVVTAAVTWAGGFGALVTYLFTYQQKENHARRERRQKEIISSREHERILMIEEERAKRERDLAELQRIEAEFAALSADFAKPDALSQINAAIGMGELARRPDPRRVRAGNDLPDFDDVHYSQLKTYAGENFSVLSEPRPWPESWRTIKTERNYPYLLRAAGRLAAAISGWSDGRARAQALRVIGEISDFAKAEGTDEPLLHSMANTIADANRTAWIRSAKLAGEAEGLGKPRTAVLQTFGVVPQHLTCDLEEFFYREFYSMEVDFRQITPIWALRGRMKFYQKDSISETDDRKGSEYELVVATTNLKDAITHLWATRDALSLVIKKLSRPPELFPYGLRLPESKSDREVLSKLLKSRRNLKLQDVFLYDADLSFAQLQGADLRSALLAKSDLSRADLSLGVLFIARLDGANMELTAFVGAECEASSFSASSCHKSIFRYSICSSAIFIFAECIGADFSGAKLNSANFISTRCMQARFTRADCRGLQLLNADCSAVNFDGASMEGAYLAGVVPQGDGTELARMQECNWSDANFRRVDINSRGQIDPESGHFDAKTWRLLNHLYPATSPRIPPREMDFAEAPVAPEPPEV